MSYAFIVFCIALSGGVAAVLTLLFFSWLFSSKPEPREHVVYSARYEAGLWNVYYDDGSLDEPLRIACFADVRDAEHLLTKVEQYVRTPGPVDEPAVPIFDEPCEGRR